MSRQAAKKADSRKKTLKPKAGWQNLKSEQTRATILEAAIKCFIEIGYAQTTTWKIAECAGVSRGAMTHHFKSRNEVINAAAAYLNEKRSKEFNQLLSKISRPELLELTRDDFLDSIRAVGRFVTLPSFTAFHELTVAARTDKELAQIIHPVEKILEKSITDTVMTVFPVWHGMENTLGILTDLVFFSIQGMAMSHMHQKKVRKERLLGLLADEAFRIYKLNLDHSKAGSQEIMRTALVENIHN